MQRCLPAALSEPPDGSSQRSNLLAWPAGSQKSFLGNSLGRVSPHAGKDQTATEADRAFLQASLEPDLGIGWERAQNSCSVCRMANFLHWPAWVGMVVTMEGNDDKRASWKTRQGITQDALPDRQNVFLLWWPFMLPSQSL